MKKNPTEPKNLLASCYLYIDLYALKNEMGVQMRGR